MLSMSIQSSINGTFTCPSFPSPNPSFKPLKTSIPMKHSVFYLHSSNILELRDRPIKRIQRLSASATTEAVTEESSSENPTPATSQDSEPSEEAEKLEVVVKSVAKPRLVLKFIWMEKNIGLALDQVIQGHGTIPLSPYHFWPRKDAWEELKSTLESKPWISQKKMIILLNQATDIINLWQQSGGNLS